MELLINLLHSIHFVHIKEGGLDMDISTLIACRPPDFKRPDGQHLTLHGRFIVPLREGRARLSR